ncbi:DNA polymerase IV [Snodgrassella alvi]|uniref:DNA polymerase IV n=1 Tax=Snodgrassella alvi TaxID=1196083 RepID=UPI00351A4EFD
MTERKIIHIDMDAFYASVELRDRPELKDQPVVVAWDGPRSVICAASYPARQYGLHSAMSVTTAKRLCPQAIYIPPDFNKYRAVSSQIHNIFRRYTDQIEPLSLDEAYLDVTDYKGRLPYARDIAREIRASILKETGLTASAGIAPNKFLAKIASDWRKPNGQFVIAPVQVLDFLHNLPLGKIPGVGKVTEQKMNALGWKTVGDLSKVSMSVLVHHFGRWGYRLFDLAQGRDDREVTPERNRQQISTEITLDNNESLQEIARHLPDLAEVLVQNMQRKGLQGNCITLKLKNTQFQIYTRSQTYSSPLPDAAALVAAGMDLMQRMPDDEALFRLIGLGISDFYQHEYQADLWSPEHSC